jgi:hypothetical protein
MHAVLAVATRSLSLAWPSSGDFHYGMGCKSSCSPYITVVGSTITITADSSTEPRVQFAEARFVLFSPATPSPVFDVAHDVLWILPDSTNPASTIEQPCPGLITRVIYDASDRRVGVNVTGITSTSTMNRCLHRLYYTNTAASASETLLGPRHISVHADSTHLAYSYTTVGATRLLYVEESCPSGGCTSSPSGVPPGTTPIGDATPSRTPNAHSGAASQPLALAALAGSFIAVLAGSWFAL